MPTQWVTPKLLHRYRDIGIWHVYHDDNLSDYHYTTEPTEDDIDVSTDNQFDIRDLPGFSKVDDKGDYRKKLIEKEIDKLLDGHGEEEDASFFEGYQTTEPDDVESMTEVNLSKVEMATVLAGLRTFQYNRAFGHMVRGRPVDEMEHFTHDIQALSDKQIDALCERLNM